METLERKFTLQVPSSTENLALIREFVGSTAQQAGYVYAGRAGEPVRLRRCTWSKGKAGELAAGLYARSAVFADGVAEAARYINTLDR